MRLDDVRLRFFRYLLLFVVSVPVLLHGGPTLGADEEILARQAEEAGAYRESLNHYMSALLSAHEGTAKDQQLREKIIVLVRNIKPAPAIPEEARRYAARGQAAVEDAKNRSDYVEAANEFRKAVDAAPWWADAYFNLGVTLEKAEQYPEAIRNLKLYLRAAPGANDLQAVNTKIFKLEYRMEKAAKTLRLDGEWTGTIDQPDIPNHVNTLTGNDVYKIKTDGTSVKIILVSVANVKPYSFFGNKYNQPIGQVVFNLRLDGATLDGTYFQPVLSQMNPARELAVTGEVRGDSNAIVLKFKESITVKGAFGAPVTPDTPTIYLTMKRR